MSCPGVCIDLREASALHSANVAQFQFCIEIQVAAAGALLYCLYLGEMLVAWAHTVVDQWHYLANHD